VLLTVLGVVGYGNSLRNAFMLDDRVVLFGQDGVAYQSWTGLFTHYQFQFFRPFGHVLLKAAAAVFGRHPVGYHVVNLGLLLAIAFLFYRITRELFHDEALAVTTSILYLLHPINGMLVNYITASVIATFVLCLQGSFWCFLRFEATGRKAFYAGSLFLLFLGLLSHEMSVAFPFYLVCLLVFLRQRSWKETLRLTAPYFGLVLAYMVFRWYVFNLRIVAFGVSRFLPDVSLYVAVVGDFLLWYLSKLVWPKDILFLWTGFVFDELLVWKVLKGLLLAAIACGLLARWRKGLKAFGLSFFLVGVMPVAVACFTYVPHVEPIFEPHWLYFASYGLFLLAACAGLKLYRHWSRGAGLAIGGLVVVGLVGALWVNNRHWRDQETYCRYWLRINPRNLTPYHGLGQVLLERGRFEEAKKYFLKGSDRVLYNSYFVAADLGYAYFLSGDRATARRLYQKALNLNPAYARTYFYIGRLLLAEGNPEEARKSFLMACRLFPQKEEYRRALDATDQLLKKAKNKG